MSVLKSKERREYILVKGFQFVGQFFQGHGTASRIANIALVVAIILPYNADEILGTHSSPPPVYF
jgi:hypothetical protein